MIANQIILENVQYGQPQGRYDGSSQDWSSDPVQAADYYKGRSSAQTFLIEVTDFVGVIYLEATLDSNNTSAIWFKTYQYGDPVNPVTDHHYTTVPGNFVWMRVRVEGFDSGTIDKITITYP
jgi:hypothetical protein